MLSAVALTTLPKRETRIHKDICFLFFRVLLNLTYLKILTLVVL